MLVMVIFFVVVSSLPRNVASASPQVSPVIGILSQPAGGEHNNTTNDEYIIAASYVKWLEAGGARSIPIPYDAHPSLVQDLFGQISGLLLPGGASDVPQSVRYLLTLAMQASESNNDFFPVWGTCLGFEYIAQVVSNSSTTTSPILVEGFDAENISLPLENVVQRELYRDPNIYEDVTKYNITMNNHFKAVEPTRFQKDIKLNELFEITSTNVDRKGRPFVSTIEPRNPQKTPWYGVQYHPEKNSFEYGSYPGTNIPYEAIDHSDRAVDFAAYLARFFVKLTTLQPAQFGVSGSHKHEYTKPTLYPLVDTYPMKRGLGFHQYYVIPSAKQWSSDNAGEYK